MEQLPLAWEKTREQNRWHAQARYKPQRSGNYYAAVTCAGQEIFSYFAAWKPGITAVNFWVQMPAEYHAAGNLKDLYLPEVRAGHLPLDYELVLVGEQVFTPDWAPRDLFRRAQVETGAEVIPFLDGGYFHKLAPEFNANFENIAETMSADVRSLISDATFAVHGLRKLPDPTFHPLSVDQCSAVIEGAQRYWKEWGFRPFTGVSTYSPSNKLVEGCRRKGLTWLSGVFPDLDFCDGADRWLGSWRQRHHGMPSFPYLISTVDYRLAGRADEQGTMMFQGLQNHPLWDYDNRHSYGTDPGGADGSSRPAGVDLARMMRYTQVFERNNALANNTFPMAETFCIQMNNPNNKALLLKLIERARQGTLVFMHKRHLQIYFREHHITVSPDLTYTIPDAEFVAVFPVSKPYTFTDEAVWEGAQGKAGFISNPVEPLPKDRSIHLPVWWYDYRSATPKSPLENQPAVDLTGVSLEVQKVASGTRLVIQSPRQLDGLPICLWDLTSGKNQSDEWIARNRALKVAAPERLGADSIMWIIRPVIQAGTNTVILSD